MTPSVVLMSLLLGFAFTGSANDPPTATYHLTVSEVRVTFFATDENNHPVEDIRKDDFAIIDGDRVVREFRSLARSNETALDAVVLLDASESVLPRFSSTINDILRLAATQPAMGDDKLSVLSFAGVRPAVLCDHNCHSSDAGRRISAVRAAGATPLFDALAFGANFISSRRVAGVRPVLVLFSDGKDTISRTSARDALREVVASGALLYTLDVSRLDGFSRGKTALEQMAEATGGRYFSMQDGVASVLQAALQDLRASYVVTYRPPAPLLGFHTLKILPKHNLNLRFHCRTGYYYGESAP